MAGLEVDTSSYPKPPALPVQKGVLDQVKDYNEVALGPGRLQQQKQAIESNAITIDKQKFDLYNQHFNIINDELSTLANDPNTTPKEVMTRMHRKMDAFEANPAVRSQMEAEFANLPDTKLGKNGTGNPELARRLDLVKRRGQDINERVKSLYGAPGSVDDGSSVTPSRTYERGGPLPVAPPIAKQPGPGQTEYDENNQSRYRGVVPPELPQGAVPVPGGFPAQYQMGSRPGLPVAPPMVNAPPGGPTPALPVAPSGTTINQTPNTVVQNRSPVGAAAGPTPLFEEGRKAYTYDLTEASNRASAIKNLTQALPLINSKGFLSGPGTEAFTKGVSALKTWGLIDTANENDPTAVRQEVNKKLANYISSSPVGQRSDAAQALKEAASPSAKVQILPALKTLVKDAIALERIQIAMPNAFKGKDYENYIKHKGTFPQSVDERAFVLDQESEENRSKIIGEMAKKEKSTNARERGEATKFFKSLRIADEQGFYQ